MEFNDAIKVAYEFYQAHPDETLIVVTADHETGGISIGSRGGSSKVDWAKLEEQWVNAGYKNNLSSEENQKLNESCSIGWTTFGHSGAPVPTYAVGKGAEKFIGHLDNTDIKGKILCE
jgi:alkaline phosphatase